MLIAYQAADRCPRDIPLAGGQQSFLTASTMVGIDNRVVSDMWIALNQATVTVQDRQVNNSNSNSADYF